MKKLYAALILIALICTGCSNSVSQNSESSPEPNPDISAAGPPVTEAPKDTELVMLMDETYTDSIDEEICAGLNRILTDKGYNFSVKIEGRDTSEYDEYQDYLTKAKEENEKIDIFFTGYGADGKESTYTKNVEEKNLASWDEFLSTDKGKDLKQRFDSKMWKKMKVGEHIYGIYNARELSLSYYLLLNKKYFPDASPVDGFDIEKLEEVMNTLQIASTDIGFYVNEDDIYCMMGYEKNTLDDRYYNHATGKPVDDIEKEDNIKRINRFISEGEKKAWLDTSNDGLWSVYEGKFAMAVLGAYIQMVNGEQFVIDGKMYDVYSYPIMNKYIFPEKNAVMGVASWSEHKEEAFELLYAINTDADISNLLQYGIEGRDYTLEGGRVSGDISPARLASSCPANQMITFPNGAESMNKAEEYKQINQKYCFFP